MNLKAEIVKSYGDSWKEIVSTPPVRYSISCDLLFAHLLAVTTFPSCLKQLFEDSCCGWCSRMNFHLTQTEFNCCTTNNPGKWSQSNLKNKASPARSMARETLGLNVSPWKSMRVIIWATLNTCTVIANSAPSWDSSPPEQVDRWRCRHPQDNY